MEEVSSLAKRERIFVAIVLAAYLVCSIPMFNIYIGNPDTASYIAVAQKYAAGNFKDAINGYWSPLFSWLMVPLLALKINAVVAAKVVSVLSGLLLVIGAYRLSFRFRLTSTFRAMIPLIVAPVILIDHVFVHVGPDMLVAALLLFYLTVLFDPNYMARKHAGTLCAVLGALAFLAKLYAFFFFVAHFLLVHAVLYLRSPRGSVRKRVAVRAASAVLVFALLCVPWTAALSLKYGKITTGTASKLNIYLHGPQADLGQPQAYVGLLPPPNPTAIFTWEDPSNNPYILWSPFQSAWDFRYWLDIVRNVLKEFWRILNEWSVLSWPILALGALAAVIEFFRKKRPGVFSAGIATVVLYSSGYAALFVQDRYILLDFVLIVLLGAVFLQAAFKTRVLSAPILRGGIIALFALTFLILPNKFLPRHFHNRTRFIVDPNGYSDMQIYQMSQILDRNFHLRGRIASNTNIGTTLFIAYYLDLHYYGQRGAFQTVEELEASLAKYKIDYFFLWFENPERYPFLKRYPELTHGKFPQLRLYDLRQERAVENSAPRPLFPPGRPRVVGPGGII